MKLGSLAVGALLAVSCSRPSPKPEGGAPPTVGVEHTGGSRRLLEPDSGTTVVWHCSPDAGCWNAATGERVVDDAAGSQVGPVTRRRSASRP